MGIRSIPIEKVENGIALLLVKRLKSYISLLCYEICGINYVVSQLGIYVLFQYSPERIGNSLNRKLNNNEKYKTLFPV